MMTTAIIRLSPKRFVVVESGTTFHPAGGDPVTLFNADNADNVFTTSLQAASWIAHKRKGGFKPKPKPKKYDL